MASNSTLSVKLPKEQLPTSVIIGLAAIVALGTTFAISSRHGEDRSSFDRRIGQNMISSPSVLGFGAGTTQSSIDIQESEFEFEPREDSFPPQLTFSDPVPQQRFDPPDTMQPELQNVPVGDVARPALAAPEPEPEYVLRSSGPTAALIVDRGVSRRSALLGRQSSAAQSTESTFETLKLEAPNQSASVLRSGTLIPAILETAIDTSQPGEARAMVTENVRSSTSTDVLIPKGARLVGEFSISTNQRQKRVVVNWSRLILPDGYQVRIDFPTTDKSGASGVPGKVHSNTVGRVLSSVLQSALDIVTFRAANAGRDGSVLVAVPVGAAGSAQALIPQPNSQRRITVEAGAQINVFVAQDIDFSR